MGGEESKYYLQKPSRYLTTQAQKHTPETIRHWQPFGRIFPVTKPEKVLKWGRGLIINEQLIVKSCQTPR